MTYTLAELEVSPAVYREVRRKLRDAGWGHAIDRCGIDMTGVRIVKCEEPERAFVTNPREAS